MVCYSIFWSSQSYYLQKQEEKHYKENYKDKTLQRKLQRKHFKEKHYKG